MTGPPPTRGAPLFLAACLTVVAVLHLTDLAASTQGLLHLGVQAATLLVVLRVPRTNTTDPRIWRSLAAGLTCWLLAELLQRLVTMAPDGGLATAVVVLHVGGQAGVTLALWWLLRTRRDVLDLGRALDTAIVAVGMGVPAVVWWIVPAVESVTSAVDATALVAVDGMLLVAMALLLVRLLLDGVRGQPRLQLFSVGLGALLVAQFEVAARFASGAPDVDGRLGLGGLLFLACTGASALLPVSPVARLHPAEARIGPLAVAGLAATASVPAVLLAAVMLHGSASVATVVGTTLATVLGIGLLSARIGHLLHTSRHAARDQTDRADRQAELVAQLQEVETLKNAFLSAVSHELRTPLTSILGMSELLAAPEADRLDDRQRRELTLRLAGNARRLERLLADLLDLQRLTQRRVETRREPLDVADLARTVLDHHRDTEPGDAAHLHGPAGSVGAHVDAMMFERIVDNLVGNARRHTPPGTEVWVELAPLRDGGVVLTVSDAGAGIPSADRTRVLEAFTRLHPETPTPGTGIGLSLVAQFTRLHGGRVTVDDRPGGGARFTVELPGPAVPVPAPGPVAVEDADGTALDRLVAP